MEASEPALDLFLSNFTNRLDAKGRVSIPAPFRAVLAGTGSRGCTSIRRSTRRPLDCGGHALLGEIEALLAPLSPESEDWDAFASTLYGQSEVLKSTAEGRIVLTEKLKAHAGISAEVTFVGMGQKFQIWEPSRFRAYLAEAKDRVREARRQLGLPMGRRPHRPSSGSTGMTAGAATGLRALSLADRPVIIPCSATRSSRRSSRSAGGALPRRHLRRRRLHARHPGACRARA